MTAPVWGTHPDPGDPYPDCGHEWHGADGGPCPACGWDSHPIPTGRALAVEAASPPWDVLDDCGVCLLVLTADGQMRTNHTNCPTHRPA